MPKEFTKVEIKDNGNKGACSFAIIQDGVVFNLEDVVGYKIHRKVDGLQMVSFTIIANATLKGNTNG